MEQSACCPLPTEVRTGVGYYGSSRTRHAEGGETITRGISRVIGRYPATRPAEGSFPAALSCSVDDTADGDPIQEPCACIYVLPN